MFSERVIIAAFKGHNRGMIKTGTSIYTIREAVRECCNGPVSVSLNLGRNKFVTFPATLSGVYPAHCVPAYHPQYSAAPPGFI